MSTIVASIREKARQTSFLESVKTLVFVYVILRQSVKANRHLRARGVRETVLDFWSWLCQVCRKFALVARRYYKLILRLICYQHIILTVLRLPAAKQKVDAQLGEARLKIENSMVTKGPDVVRHLALPIEGRSREWIAQEMEKMDNETGKSERWKGGRLSGAVYRESSFSLSSFPLLPR
jgi:sphinganine-1-phosphate aldolase